MLVGEAVTGAGVGPVGVADDGVEVEGTFVGMAVGASVGPLGTAVGVTDINRTPAQNPSSRGTCIMSVLVPAGAPVILLLEVSYLMEATRLSTAAALVMKIEAGFFPRFAAASPETCGHAMEVPEMVQDGFGAHAVFREEHTETMLTPGANKSIIEP